MEPQDFRNSEDNETCAPEIICGSASNSFNESDISLETPYCQSSDIFELPKDHKKPTKGKRFTIATIKIENICINCDKKYNKALNLDTACIYHKDKWNGNLYPCCNQSYFGALGCKTSRHMTLDEKEKEKIKLVEFCTSCREYGHLAKNCPKDPNTRTGENPLEELHRISLLKSSKIPCKVMTTNRKYEVDKEGFSDIAKLKATIKAKKTLGEGSSMRNNNIFSLNTEEAEQSRLKEAWR